MIRLVIKGHRFEASAKASSLGIPMVFRSERMTSGQAQGNVSLSSRAYETIGECPDGYLSSVLCWFREPHKMIPGYGYPVGTLLWYRVPGGIESVPIDA